MSIFEYNEEAHLKSIREDGYEDGYGNGYGDGKAEDILELLEDYGEIPQEIKDKIYGEKDLDVLKRWLKAAAKAASLEEFISKIK